MNKFIQSMLHSTKINTPRLFFPASGRTRISPLPRGRGFFDAAEGVGGVDSFRSTAPRRARWSSCALELREMTNVHFICFMDNLFIFIYIYIFIYYLYIYIYIIYIYIYIYIIYIYYLYIYISLFIFVCLYIYIQHTCIPQMHTNAYMYMLCIYNVLHTHVISVRDETLITWTKKQKVRVSPSDSTKCLNIFNVPKQRISD